MREQVSATIDELIQWHEACAAYYKQFVGLKPAEAASYAIYLEFNKGGIVPKGEQNA